MKDGSSSSTPAKAVASAKDRGWRNLSQQTSIKQKRIIKGARGCRKCERSAAAEIKLAQQTYDRTKALYEKTVVQERTFSRPSTIWK
jgi:multidrug resistance efflux pump